MSIPHFQLLSRSEKPRESHSLPKYPVLSNYISSLFQSWIRPTMFYISFPPLTFPPYYPPETATTLLPPSHVTLFLTLTFNMPSLSLAHFPSPSAVLTIADGANTKASPVLRLTILWNSSTPLPPLLSSMIEMCRRRMLNHSGLEKRWITVIEHRSISWGDIVGSWVLMITRAP